MPITVSDWPMLYLGDRGYLQRHGSVLSNAKVEQRMLHFLKRYPAGGLAAGDARTRACAQKVLGRSVHHLAIHTDLPLRIGEVDAPSLYPAAMHTLGHVASQLTGGRALIDPITGPFFARFAQYASLGSKTPTLDASAFATELAEIERARPGLISIGGDWLDLLLCSNQTAVVNSALEEIFQVAHGAGARVVLSTYFGPACIQATNALLERFNWYGVLLPCNAIGDGMFPNNTAAIRWHCTTGLPLYAMHTLADGRIVAQCGMSVTEALAWVWDEAGVSGAFVGASQPENIATLADAAIAILEERR